MPTSSRGRSRSSSRKQQGLILRVVEQRVVVEKTQRAGSWIEVLHGDVQHFGHLCRLELDPASPLTPRTAQMEPLRARRGKPEVPERALTDGVWWCTAGQERVEHFFTVAGAVIALVTKVQAYLALGAVARLHEMGLGDAAVSLEAGDFDHASVQVIAERDRLRGG